jgi:hypothetical protein
MSDVRSRTGETRLAVSPTPAIRRGPIVAPTYAIGRQLFGGGAPAAAGCPETACRTHPARDRTVSDTPCLHGPEHERHQTANDTVETADRGADGLIITRVRFAVCGRHHAWKTVRSNVRERVDLQRCIFNSHLWTPIWGRYIPSPRTKLVISSVYSHDDVRSLGFTDAGETTHVIADKSSSARRRAKDQ